MLYAAVRPIAKIGLQHYFRRIDLANTDRIPKDAAVIIAANHPTTFIEPCVLACFLDHPLNFMARGDFFKNPIAAKLLAGVNIIPVFRLSDGGIKGVKSNYKSFERAFDILSQKKTLMILAEGRCIHEKRLRPIRKGTARIALGALDSTNLKEVYIVPIGANFTYADRPRSDIMLNVGEPILASEYFSSFKESPNLAINQLTQRLSDELSKDIVIIDHRDDEALVENILRLYRTEHPSTSKDRITTEEAPLRAEKKIADRVNILDTAEKNQLKLLTHDYFSRLERMRINDESLRGIYRKEQKKTVQVIAGFLPVLLTLFWHLPPILFSQWFSAVKIKTIEFSGPVRWAGLLITYTLYSIFWITLAASTSQWIYLLIWLIGMLSGPLIIKYIETSYKWLLAWRTRRQTTHEIDYVREKRAEIMQEVLSFWQ